VGQGPGAVGNQQENEMKIELGKSYTSNGEPATIRYIDGKSPDFPVLAELPDGTIRHFTAEGKHNITMPSKFDLVEVSPYADWEIDQKVMVSDDGVLWRKRYFAGVNSEGKPIVFYDGATSWSTSEKLLWPLIRLPTAEELGE